MIEDEQESTVLTLSDLISVIKKRKKMVLAIVFFTTFFAILYPLTKGIQYQAKASFMDRGAKSFGIGSGLMSLVGGSAKMSGETLSLLQSKCLMQRVVKQLDLQAKISDPQKKSPGKLRTIFDNWKLYRAIKSNSQQPMFADNMDRLVATNVSFTGEYPKTYQIQFEEKEHFLIYQGKICLAKGVLGTQVIIPDAAFTLQTPSSSVEKGNRFSLSLLPMNQVCDQLVKKIKAEPDQDGIESLLHCFVTDSDRHKAAVLLNTILAQLEEQLAEDGQKTGQRQVDYLEKRLKERSAELARVMQAHADLCSEDLATTGFMDAKDHLSFLSSNQATIQARIMQIDLEIRRLQNIDVNTCAHYDYVGATADASVINRSLASIRELAKKRDVLDLQTPLFTADADRLEQQQKEFNELELFSRQTDQLLADVEKDHFHSSYPVQFATDTIAPKWYQRLREKFTNLQDPEKTFDLSTWDREKQSFSSYLQNIKRIFGVKQEVIQERMAHQRDVAEDGLALNLETAADLFLSYTRELDDLDFTIRDRKFLLDMANDPSVDVATLTGLPADAITQGVIARVSQMNLQLNDQDNRSEKELNRIRSEIALQREYLVGHLSASHEMLIARKQLLEEKIAAVQNIEADLIHQRISVEKRDLAEYISARVKNLQHERKVQFTHLDELSFHMASIPRKWVSEKLLEDELEANQKVVENMVQLVESKVLSKNLELIQSAVLDKAIPPLLPMGPRVKLFAVLGLFSGLVFGVVAALALGLSEGIPASSDALQMQGKHVAGLIRTDIEKKAVLADSDLATLRKAISYCFRKSKENKRLLLLLGKGPNFSSHLATVLAKQGEKVLLVPISFEQNSSDCGIGILQVVSGQASHPTIIEEDGYDRIAEGGVNRYSTEIVQSAPFQTMLEEMEKKYTRVLLVSYATPGSAESEVLLQNEKTVVASLKREPMKSLNAFMGKDSLISFVFSK